MYRSASDRSLRAAALLATGIALLQAAPASAAMQQKQIEAQGPQASTIIGSDIAISREHAELKLELANGRKLTLSTVAGNNRGLLHSGVSGTPDDLTQVITLGVRRGDELDRAWRELLNEAMETPADDLAGLLTRWEAPSGGNALDDLLDNAILGTPMAALPAQDPTGSHLGDSLSKLQDKIMDLEQALEEQHDDAVSVDRYVDRDRGSDWFGPLRHVGRGLAGIMSLLITMAVLFGLGFVLVFFGGRRHLEGVADAARHATMRSFLVGIAGSFLVIPAFVLGTIVLVVSIVGIPALLIWIPAFPLAVVLSCLLGYIGVAHATGEAMAERRFYGGDWFSRANSYYYLMTGLGLLLALFFAANIIQMAGPWLNFIEGILIFLGVVLSWAAVTTGFGAVLITRAGSRPLRSSRGAEPESYGDATNV